LASQDFNGLEGISMTDDLIEAVALTIKAEVGKQMNAQPIHPDPAVDDWAGTGGEINLTAIAASVCGLFADRIEAQAAEIERLREALAKVLLVKQHTMNPIHTIQQMQFIARAALGETE
jgi:hypothetical protein